MPSPGKCTRLDSLQLQHFGSNKKNQNRSILYFPGEGKCSVLPMPEGAHDDDDDGKDDDDTNDFFKRIYDFCRYSVSQKL